MIYMDNAATSFPKPVEVAEAVMRQLEDVGGSAGRSSHQGGLATSRLLYETRCLLAQLINATDPLRIVFTANGTEALNVALQGTLMAGDHVVTTSMEHNSVLRPLRHLEYKGISHTIVRADETGRVKAEDIEDAVKPETRMIAMTHCSNVTGSLQPVTEVAEIARERGVLFLLDGAQSCGTIPVDLSKIPVDFLAAPGHKGLLGPQGTGFLYMSPAVEPASLKQGGTGSRSEDRTQPEYLPDRLESGTQNLHGIAGLKAGVSFLLKHGVETIRDHEKTCVRRLMDGMKDISGVVLYGQKDPEQQGSVISFTLKGLDVNQLNYVLDTVYHISARSGLHCAPLAHQTIGTYPMGTIRFSPGVFTTIQEIDQTLSAIHQMARQL